MVTKQYIDLQMRRIGLKMRIFGRSEVNELHNIIEPDENIVQSAYGYYQGGSGLLVLTDKRLLLVDKRPFYLNLESMPFERIREIDFAQRALQGTMYLSSDVKKIVFRSLSDARLHNICSYAQEKVDEIKRPIFVSASTPNVQNKPYLNPAWRPHHITFNRRARPSKYHRSTSRTATG